MSEGNKITGETNEAMGAKRTLLAQLIRDRSIEPQLFTCSYAQQRMWLFEQMQPGTPAYNVTTALLLHGSLDVDTLEKSIESITHRHEVLRTTFVVQGDDVKQRINPRRSIAIPIIDVQSVKGEIRRAMHLHRFVTQIGQTGFDIQGGPLLRVAVIKLGLKEHGLVLSMHHIVCDSWSMGIFMHEVIASYLASIQGFDPTLPPLPIQYRDYAVWQNRWMQSEQAKEQLNYWKRELSNPLPEVQFPTDRPRAESGNSFESGIVQFCINHQLTAQLQMLSRRAGATLFMALLAAWQVVLHRYSGEDDVLVGSPISNRNRPELEGLIGFFSNTIVFRSDLSGNPRFMSLLWQVRETAIKNYANQDLPFERIVKELQPQRSPGRNPIFDVLFALEHLPPSYTILPDFSVSTVPPEDITTPLDMILQLTENQGDMEGWLAYRAQIFDRFTVEGVIRSFTQLLVEIIQQPEQRILELPLLTREQERELLERIQGRCPHGATAPGRGSDQSWLHAPEHLSADLQHSDLAGEEKGFSHSVLVLTPDLRLTPPGVVGDLYMLGFAVPRSEPDTGEQSWSWIPDPYSSDPAARLFKTGDRGRRLDDGRIVIVERGERHAWMDGRRVSLASVEAVLTLYPAIKGAVVLAHQDAARKIKLVAYIIPNGPFSMEHLQAHVKQRLPSGVDLCAYVKVSNFPFDTRGVIDEAVLAKLPVLDSKLVEEWESRLRALPELGQVAVVLSQQVEAVPLLHLDDLFPEGWTTTEPQSSKRASAPAEVLGASSGMAQRMAIAHGDVLELSADAPQTLPEALLRAATMFTGAGIHYIEGDGREDIQSYSELLNEATRIMGGLKSLGLHPKDKVLFQLESNVEFLGAFWACVLGGYIPVPISVPLDSYRVTVKLKNAWEMFDRPLILASEHIEADIQAGLAESSSASPQTAVVSRLRLHAADGQYSVAQADETALILLTSGSTDRPKGVPLTHANILSRSAATARMNRFTSEDTSLNWLPLDHVGGLVMFHVMDVYTGCRQVHVATQLVLSDVLRWLDWLDHYRVTITWAPNFAFRQVNDRAEDIKNRNWDLSRLRFILNGGEAITPRTAATFLTLLAPHRLLGTAMHPAWGMSETSSGITFSDEFRASSGTGRFVEVGRPVPGTSVRIVDQNGHLMIEGATGSVQVKGPTVTRGYYQRPDINSQVFTRDGWFETGDIGILRDGRLTITGRNKDVIIINGNNFYSQEIEAVVEDIKGVEASYTAACAVRKAERNDTDQVAVFFHTSLPQVEIPTLLSTIREQLTRNLGINPEYLLPVAKDEIPKTQSGKIQRSLLSLRFEEGAYDSVLRQLDLQASNRNTAPDLFYELNWAPKAARAVADAPQSGPFLIFMDSVGLGESLSPVLQQRGCKVITIRAAGAFERSSEHEYRINPGIADHYKKLFAFLSQDQILPSIILHLWLFNEPDEPEPDSITRLQESQKPAVYSLVWILQSLRSVAGCPGRIRLDVITSNAWRVIAGDRVAFHKGSIDGFLRTIPLELDWIECHQIDLPSSDSVEKNCRVVLREMSVVAGDEQIAYRRGRRFVPFLRKVNLLQEHYTPSVIRKGGLYLITGGLGGIGTELAQFLLQRCDAKLVLVGRSQLPERSTWNEYLEHASGENRAHLGSALAKKILNYLQLEKAGTSWVYEAMDATSSHALEAAVARAERAWETPLTAVFHLAAEGHLATHWPVAGKHVILEETPDVFEWMFKPKAYLAWSLFEFLRSRTGTPIICFSSVNSLFGGASFSAYSAANSLLDAMVSSRREGAHPNAYCYRWSSWDDCGMSKGNPAYAREAAAAMGFAALSVRQGLAALAGAVNRGIQNLVVGVNAGNHRILTRIEAAPQALDRVEAFFTSTSHMEAASLHSIRMHDLLGRAVDCEMVRVSELPFTESGTVDRDRLRMQRAARARPVCEDGPASNIEERVRAIWREVLNLSDVGLNEQFFDLGGHSLLATQLISRLCEAFRLKLPLRSVFEHQTIAEYARYVQQMQAGGQAGDEMFAIPIARAERKRELPLSHSQERLWFLTQLAPGNAFYNVPFALRLRGFLNHTALRNSFIEIRRRHEILRTSFISVDGRPQQRISPEPDLPLPLVDLSSLPPDAREVLMLQLANEQARHSFDLGADLLVRTVLVRMGEEETVLLVAMHHIVSDGWSIGVMVKELGVLYEAFCEGRPSPLPELPLQYADYSVWQRTWLSGKQLEDLLTYWRAKLEAVSTLELPADRLRLPLQRFRGAHISRDFGQSLSKDLLKFSRGFGVTLFMTLLAGFKILLARLSGQTDFCVGTPIANRSRNELEALIGFFVNTLALRTDLSGNPSANELLARVRSTCLDAYAHQSLPFEQLVEILQPERDVSRQPLFQVSFAVQNAPLPAFKLAGLDWRGIGLDIGAARFDLECHVWQREDNLSCIYEYNPDLFDQATIERMAGYWEILLAAMVTGPERRIHDLDLLSEREKRLILVEWNDTAQAGTTGKYIHQMFEEQARKTPAAQAVISGSQSVTYRHLNERANQLASYLIAQGVRPETCIGICLERGLDMIAAILSVVKVGAAYLPLDPEYPEVRLLYMLDDAKAPLLITDQRNQVKLNGATVPSILIDTDWNQIASAKLTPPAALLHDKNAAYVIYTSGSTGVPKGVINTHEGIRNRLLWMQREFGLTPQDRVLQKTSFAFDVSVWEIFWPLITGATVVLARPGGNRNAEHIANLIEKEQVTVVHFVPPMLEVFLHEADLKQCHGLRYVICSGEELSLKTQQYFQQKLGAQLYNLYGPTEAAIDVTSWECMPSHEGTTVPIGKPIANTGIYILDEHSNPAPIGVTGELYISGIGLARGYLGRPDLTAERFVPDPFSAEGRRLYRTGDLGRFRNDGTIEFVGRMDSQVKIRGYRIEMQEVELALRQHATVREAVVLAHGEGTRQQLIAYLIRQATVDSEATALDSDYIHRWESVFDQIYNPDQPVDPLFNIAGWNSSYTGLPIRVEEMREWVDNAIERILRMKATRVLEIGCGTGLLATRLAPHYSSYRATDASIAAVRALSQTAADIPRLENLVVEHRTADDFSGFEPGMFDMVVLNSVVQYFPSVNYLLRVLEGAAHALGGRGVIFVGDVRNLLLLQVEHASVEVARAPGSMKREELRELVERRVGEEEELLLSPAFFFALQQRIPQICHVTVQPKWGRYGNQMTKFRFDATLHLGGETSTHCELPELKWRERNLTPARLFDELRQESVPQLRVAWIPNSRLVSDLAVLRWLSGQASAETVGKLREVLAHSASGTETDPQTLRDFLAPLPYEAIPDWSRCGADGDYDMLLLPRHAAGEFPATEPASPVAEGALEDYANQPLRRHFDDLQVKELKALLSGRLPAYMVPNNFVFLDRLPKTTSGKIDRKNLPLPQTIAVRANSRFQPARTAVEFRLLRIWEDLFHRTLGVADNFFDLGGTSLLSVSLLARIQKVFRKKVSLAALFRQPTIEGLAELVRNGSDEREWSSLISIQPGEDGEPPFFCVHPGAGGVDCYVDLARHLSKEQPIYGFQPWGLYPGQQPHDTVEEMAAAYVRELQKMHPDGQYYLGGWSFGGAVAYEMARILADQGHPAILLTIFDMGPTIFRWAQRKSDEAEFLAMVLREHLPVAHEVLREMTPDDRIAYILKQARVQGLGLGGLDIEEARRLRDVAKAHVHAQAVYIPRPYSGQLTLFRAMNDAKEAGPDLSLGWSGLVSGDVGIHQIPCSHSEIISEPFVREVAGVLATRFAEAKHTRCGRQNLEQLTHS